MFRLGCLPINLLSCIGCLPGIVEVCLISCILLLVFLFLCLDVKGKIVSVLVFRVLVFADFVGF